LQAAEALRFFRFAEPGNRWPTPDAIRLTTAIRFGAPWFLTNDASLPQGPGPSMLVLKQLP